jgi:hypothetical protein
VWEARECRKGGKGSVGGGKNVGGKRGGRNVGSRVRGSDVG